MDCAQKFGEGGEEGLLGFAIVCVLQQVRMQCGAFEKREGLFVGTRGLFV